MTIRLPATLETPRLVLTAARPGDAAAQVAAVNASLTEFAPWLPWATGPATVDRTERLLAQDAADFAAGAAFHWLGRLPGSDEVVCRISLMRVDPAVPKGEIGYWTATAHTGRGYMREATQVVTNTALAAGFRRVEIRCDPLNAASAAVPRALGYALDGVLRNDRYDAHAGVLRHTMIWSRTV